MIIKTQTHNFWRTLSRLLNYNLISLNHENLSFYRSDLSAIGRVFISVKKSFLDSLHLSSASFTEGILAECRHYFFDCERILICETHNSNKNSLKVAWRNELQILNFIISHELEESCFSVLQRFWRLSGHWLRFAHISNFVRKRVEMLRRIKIENMAVLNHSIQRFPIVLEGNMEFCRYVCAESVGWPVAHRLPYT